MGFKIESPPVEVGADISTRSFEIIHKELNDYPKSKLFDREQLEVIGRLIHTTTCFDEVLENIYFSDGAISKIKDLLKNKAKIIVDVNMIKAGLSEFYLKTYGNDVVCHINDPSVFEAAEQNKTTRSYAAAKSAIEKYKNEPMILACGNAPTFIYAAINTLLKEGVDLKNVALLSFPVGFVNVTESKEYAKRFSEHFGVSAIIMRGRFGSSTMVVATLHAIYKLIYDFDKAEKYNGK